jgi:ribosomal protein L11 methylase PrmA
MQLMDQQPTSELTDWVIAGLEGRFHSHDLQSRRENADKLSNAFTIKPQIHSGKNESITSVDPVKAGEGDTLPPDGLIIGKVRIIPAGHEEQTNSINNDGLIPIKLLLGRNGWGTGVHPTTRLCLEWICDNTRDGDVLLDYGCGSGILSIASLHSGASKCVGVDVEAEALVTAERNVALNGWESGRFEGLHTREVLPYEVCPPRGASLCVANILIGQVSLSSIVSVTSLYSLNCAACETFNGSCYRYQLRARRIALLIRNKTWRGTVTKGGV